MTNLPNKDTKKIIDLIVDLLWILLKHGNVPVYSEVDWDWVTDAHYVDHTYEIFNLVDHARLT